MQVIPWDKGLINPLTSINDQGRISPYNINTLSSRQVRRIKRNINQGIISWSKPKFSQPELQKLYWRQEGELLMRSWGWKDLKGLKIHVSLHTHFLHFTLPLKGLEEYYATGKISFLLPSLVLFVEWSNTVY